MANACNSSYTFTFTAAHFYDIQVLTGHQILLKTPSLKRTCNLTYCLRITRITVASSTPLTPGSLVVSLPTVHVLTTRRKLNLKLNLVQHRHWQAGRHDQAQGDQPTSSSTAHQNVILRAQPVKSHSERYQLWT